MTKPANVAHLDQPKKPPPIITDGCKELTGWRHRHGEPGKPVSQKRVVEILGRYSQTIVSLWESGDRRPSETARRLMRVYLGIPIVRWTTADERTADLAAKAEREKRVA